MARILTRATNPVKLTGLNRHGKIHQPSKGQPMLNCIRNQFFYACLGLLLVICASGCGRGNEPVETTADELDQFLLDNPDENYTSDGLEEEMEEDDGEG